MNRLEVARNEREQKQAEGGADARLITKFLLTPRERIARIAYNAEQAAVIRLAFGG